MKKQKTRKNNWFMRFCTRALYEFAKYTGAVFVVPFMRTKRHYIGKKMPKGNLKAPLLMASNHVTELDALAILTAFPLNKFSFLMASEALSYRGGGFLRTVAAIPIDRENPKISTIKECISRFKAGDLICVFAEGRLPLANETLDIRSFKEGGALIAAMANVDVLPVFIAPRISYWHRQHIVVGNRIKTSDYILSAPATIESIALLSKEMENQVRALRAHYYALPKMKAKNKEALDNLHAKRPKLAKLTKENLSRTQLKDAKRQI